MTAKH